MSIQNTLNKQKLIHGPFTNHAELEFTLRELLSCNKKLTIVQYIGLGMIMHKIARILNSGHNHKDSWHDIAGYATLIEQSMLDE